MKAARTLHVILILVFLVNLMVLSVAVVPDYCQPPLNLSDCKLKPTPVFFYYKPGSRCEMALWRGCPTLNWFPDQYKCVDFCINKMFKNTDEDNTAFDTKNSEYSCRDYLNTNKCSNKEESVYSYDPSIELCVQATWRGCPTVNKFPDEATCQKYCEPGDQDNYDEWRKELDALSEKDTESLNQMLDKLKATESSIFEDDITEKRTTTTTVATEGSTAKTLDTSTELKTVATSEATTKPTSESTTELKTVATSGTTVKPTTESTTELKTVATSEATAKPTTESTTELKTVATSEATSKPTTESTTELKTVATSEATAKPTTESTTELKTVATSEATSKPTIESTTELKTVATSDATVKPTTESTTELKTVASSEATVKPTTESTTELKTVVTSEATKPTTESTTKSRDLPDEIQNIDYDV